MWTIQFTFISSSFCWFPPPTPVFAMKLSALPICPKPSTSLANEELIQPYGCRETVSFPAPAKKIQSLLLGSCSPLLPHPPFNTSHRHPPLCKGGLNTPVYSDLRVFLERENFSVKTWKKSWENLRSRSPYLCIAFWPHSTADGPRGPGLPWRKNGQGYRAGPRWSVMQLVHWAWTPSPGDKWRLNLATALMLWDSLEQGAFF